VTATHALALAATGMLMLIYLVAMPDEAPFCVLVALCSPFVLVLPLALQLGMPEWIFDIEVVVCIAGAAFWFTIFLRILCFGNIKDRKHSFILGSASLAFLVTALNALVPAAAVYTLLPLVWAVGSAYAISGWLACEEERVGSACARSFFGQFLTIVGSVVTLPLAVLPWVEAMPGGLFDALWFACAAMALVHLSMAFWLSDGKPHIIVAWVSSAVMGLALLQGVVTVAPPAVWALSPSPPPSPPAPPLPPSAPSYSAPPGVTAAHALALAATGMLMLIYLVAMPDEAPFCVLVAFCSPFVLALPLALQLGMPQLVSEIGALICFAAAASTLVRWRLWWWKWRIQRHGGRWRRRMTVAKPRERRVNQIFELRNERLFETSEVDVVEQVCPVAKLLRERGTRLVERVSSLGRETAVVA
jgi:hypothetical protein